MGNTIRCATERQIKYAMKIANFLGDDIYIPPNASWYMVSKYIHDKEAIFKEKNMNATPKQIDYANVIALTCNVDVLFDKNSTKDEISKFIDEHLPEYHNIVYNERYKGQYSDDRADILRGKESTRTFLIENLSKKHGIYAFVDDKGKVVYIGKSVDLASRIPSSHAERKKYVNIVRIFYYVCESMADADVLEILLINENKPMLNVESNSKDELIMFHSGFDIMKDFSELAI